MLHAAGIAVERSGPARKDTNACGDRGQGFRWDGDRLDAFLGNERAHRHGAPMRAAQGAIRLSFGRVAGSLGNDRWEAAQMGRIFLLAATDPIRLPIGVRNRNGAGRM